MHDDDEKKLKNKSLNGQTSYKRETTHFRSNNMMENALDTCWRYYHVKCLFDKNLEQVITLLSLDI